VEDKTLIAIVGPTAVGKTALAIQLALHFKTEIVSADARQVFQEMNIGTAKPSSDELLTVKHHFINSHSIHENFNAGIFAEQAEKVIHDLFKTHDKIILCGGSGLYIKALLHGFDEMPEVPTTVRQSVIEEYEKNGLEWLQQSVLKSDPDYYEAADKQNPQRLMRALEVFRATGNPFSTFRNEVKKNLPYHVIKIGLNLDRDELYARIDKRMETMIASGLFEEAEKLYPFRNLNALQTVGYSEIFDFMDGKYDKEEAIRLLKRNSRRYAKRQLTWFVRDKEVQWFRPSEFERIEKYIKENLSNLVTQKK
jgi:tRNA dimethylallyltransferase